MALQQKFEESAEKVKTLTKRPTDDELLEIYGLYKQGTVGDNDTSKPGFLDIKGKKKWEKWTEKKGMSKEKAQELYIDKIEELLAKYA